MVYLVAAAGMLIWILLGVVAYVNMDELNEKERHDNM
jgi:hypothetical protein